MGTMGLGILSAYSRRRIPRPPQKRTTFISGIPFPKAHKANAIAISFVNLHFRNRDDKLSAPFPDERQLLHNLILQIPRQDENVVGPRRAQLFGRKNRDVGARQESSVLVRIAIHCEIHKIRADAAVIQERISFSRSPVADDFLAVSLRMNQELEQLTLRFLNIFFKSCITLDTVQAGVLFALQERMHGGRNRFAVVLGMTGINPQRSAMTRQFLHVKKRKTVSRKN